MFRRSLSLSVGLSLLLMAGSLQAQSRLFEYSDSASGGRLPARSLDFGDRMVDELRSWPITISAELIRSSPERLIIELPNGETVTAFRDDFEARVDGAFWRGHIPEAGDGPCPVFLPGPTVQKRS